MSIYMPIFNYLINFMNTNFTTFQYFVYYSFITGDLDRQQSEIMCVVFYAAVDDTQRMMQMGGFGFDPSKVQILVLYCSHIFDD